MSRDIRPACYSDVQQRRGAGGGELRKQLIAGKPNRQKLSPRTPDCILGWHTGKIGSPARVGLGPPSWVGEREAGTE